MVKHSYTTPKRVLCRPKVLILFWSVFQVVALAHLEESCVNSATTKTATTAGETNSKSNDTNICEEDSNSEECQRSTKGTESKTSHQPVLECGLFLAESSIPNAGWGMYTGKSLVEDEVVGPLDVVVNIPDQETNMERRANIGMGLPSWVMTEYFWNPRWNGAHYESEDVDTIIPGFGMLANSHTGLVNVDNFGSVTKKAPKSRAEPEAGAYSYHGDLTFRTTEDVVQGMELFVEYGDSWFRDRHRIFGEDLPLSDDYVTADNLLKDFYNLVDGNLDSDFAKDFWVLWTHDLKNTTSPRVRKALPDDLKNVKKVIEIGTAMQSVPNVIRSMDWLYENGLCLDHIKAGPSTIPRAGTGAFASRNLPKGIMVSPAPLVHIHKGHLDILLTDPNEKSKVHWKGSNLLMNYVYSHPSSNLAFYAYSPGTNLINHAPTKEQANVGLRWSSQMTNPEWMKLSTEDVLHHNKKTGLMMEFVALSDIAAGEEILIDYGDEWEEAWNNHKKNWKPPHDVDSYVPAHVLNEEEEVLRTIDEESYPSNVMMACWIDSYNLGEPFEIDDDDEDAEEEYAWSYSGEGMFRHTDQSLECEILHRDSRLNKYSARIFRDDDESILVHDIPREAIVFVDLAYSADAYLRQAFRHPIKLPDEMIPDVWKDVEHDMDTCGLFMAESSIPNSGLGIYAGKGIENLANVAQPDISIPVEDLEVNRKWRNFHEYGYDIQQPDWLFEHYYWQPQNLGQTFEADEVQSIVPGLGMLANSHTGLVNTHMRRPALEGFGMTPSEDPSAGTFSNYHGVTWWANGYIPAGMEIFVGYGENWFKHREKDLGIVPFSGDFEEADRLLRDFWEKIDKDPDSALAKELWEVLWMEGTYQENDRVRIAMPRDLKDLAKAVEGGTALFSVPNAIRDSSWLEEHGRCLDNIRPGKSSIPEAGNGAFAKRRMKAGDIVAPAPMIHIDRKDLEVYDSEEFDDPNAPAWLVGHQILMNYCFGHPDSPMLLFPYSPIVNYINHDHEDFNVKLQWSSMPNHREDWLNRSVSDLMKEEFAGLIMEFVATRDIEPGEEILLDYGELWDNNWDDYNDNWEPSEDIDEEHVSAYDLNDHFTKVRTIDEEPYPGNIATKCFIRDHLDKKNTEAVTTDWGDAMKWVNGFELFRTSEAAYPCEVLRRYEVTGVSDNADNIEPHADYYTVRVNVEKDQTWLVVDVPRIAIEFFDVSYSSDMFLRNTFRQEIGIPHEIFPKAWLYY
mmetsp:Transcript_16707/g.23565  ORF Transcript_16707/g.23565 Transcript_16707/m.23565 type:complete len:1238 (-) Transcript_16707:47-3760(-)